MPITALVAVGRPVARTELGYGMTLIWDNGGVFWIDERHERGVVAWMRITNGI